MLNNITHNYFKIGSKTVDDPNFFNQNSIDCYYDDRDIEQSLTIRSAYSPNGGDWYYILVNRVGTFLVPLTFITINVAVDDFQKEQLIELIDANNDSYM